jgi:transposase-like protein
MDAKRKTPPDTPALGFLDGGWRNKTRRKFSAEQRRVIVEECLAPGATTSAVGLRHGINNVSARGRQG